MSLPPEGRDGRLGPPEPTRRVDRAALSIPVETYIRRYKVEDPLAQESLRGNPSLCYLLGSVSEQPRDLLNVQSGKTRSVRTLQEGSGMFNLTHSEDALEWKGIFNHIVGSVAHTEFLLDVFAKATPAQRAQFEALGYNFGQFDAHGAENIRDVMFVTHAGRRRSDESSWYGLTDAVHGPGDSYAHTRKLFLEERAPEPYVKILEVENHEGKLKDGIVEGRFVDISHALITYADWTFGQEPVRIVDRFAGLRKTRRVETTILDALEPASIHFENDMKSIFGIDVYEEMIGQPQKDWDRRLRQAYCAPSGLDSNTVFPPQR